MSCSRRGSATAFARRIARALEVHRGAPVVLSPRDFRLVENWYERGVPLALVLETLAEVSAERVKRGRPPRSLSSIARQVEEAWQVVSEGRRQTVLAPEDPATRASVAERWEASARRTGVPAPLAVGLAHLASRLRGEDALDALDARLDDLLVENLEPERVQKAERAAERALEGARGRMPAGAWAMTRRRAVCDLLRDELDLPRALLSVGAAGVPDSG